MIDEETIFFASLQIEQMNAGCPVECDENPMSCDKDFDEMPHECREYCRDEMMRDHIEGSSWEDNECGQGCAYYR